MVVVVVVVVASDEGKDMVNGWIWYWGVCIILYYHMPLGLLRPGNQYMYLVTSSQEIGPSN